jgi:mRNA interferase HigB
VKLINRGILHDFKQRHPDASSQVEAWEAEASDANWNMPSDIKKRYGAASFLKDSNVVFNIKGNKYRLRVRVSYKNQIVFILKAGTHTEYMAW